MSQQINDNFRLFAPKSLDDRYGKSDGGSTVPFVSIAEANSLINIAYRHQGLTVLIGNSTSSAEYWYNGGIADINLVPKGSALTTNANSGIALSGPNNSNVNTKYNTSIADSVISVAVGGATAQAASVWKTRNIVQALDAILFPDQSPTYTIPTINLSLTSGTAGTKEIGSSFGPNFSLVGTKNDAGNFTAFRILRGATPLTTSVISQVSTTNIPDQFGFANPNSPNFNFTVTASDDFAVVSGVTSYIGQGDYSAGQAKQNNKGVTDGRTALVRSTNAPQAASTNFNSSAINITGIYPYFWGVSNTAPTVSTVQSAISGGTANKVLIDASGTIAITFNATGQYLWVAHAATYTTKTKWFVNALNNGNISGPSDLFSAPTTATVNSPTSLWTGVNFKIYISNFATSTSTDAMQLQN